MLGSRCFSNYLLTRFLPNSLSKLLSQSTNNIQLYNYFASKVGEAIEAALQKMECPHPLQAHQIQGLDYPAVYPVVQWLVNHVLMTREMLGDQVLP